MSETVHQTTEKFMSPDKAAELIDEADDNLIFTVEFIKKNGERRTMNCRKGVGKYVKGVGLRFDPKEKGLRVVYDMQKWREGEDPAKAYRMININTIKKIKMRGEEYSWRNS